ncbi:LOW QUALITY PROTEIN: hypothetical protein Cgig2_023784 [Carnegiea gigantea]|uniref:Uncharacterized protein n=1 Tax=Carnegiea gigantea TaxID=171969 RepID=A0A9Q1JR83_9CARY|nr:LOW QUALITY PROTEIN: hypothetical protein Cgig2_023784 [Carnegiea gigantea]
MSWTKESLTSRSALIKLAEGRAVRDEALPATGVAVPAALEIVGCPGRAGFRSSDDRLSGRRTAGRPAGPLFPHWRGGGSPNLVRLLLGPLLLGDRQTHSGPLPVGGVQGRAPTRRRETKGGKASEGHIPYLFGLLGNKKLPLFLSLMLGSGRHLFRSGIPGLEHYQLSPRLICMKQTGSQVSTKHKIDQTLSDILKDKKASRGEKEVVRKNFSPGSQFNGSRLASSLLGPFHRLNCLSHEPRDRPRPAVLAYNIKSQVVRCSSAVGSPKGLRTGFPLFQSGTSPQPDSRHRKRKSYFQYFSFDFFSMAIMKPGLLLKQYHPRSPVSFGAF